MPQKHWYIKFENNQFDDECSIDMYQDQTLNLELENMPA